MAFTFFFRDTHVLDLITRHVVPGLAGFSRIRVWDAGCAMGPEPYTLAILFAENLGKFAFRNLTIYATDIDEGGDFEQTIAAGDYPLEALQRIPPEYLERYFVASDRPQYRRVCDGLRQRLRFTRHDLLSLSPIGDGFHLIVCKNVLLHFSPAQRVEVLRMFHRALAPGGFVATEQTQKMPAELGDLFEPVTVDGQLHRRRQP